MSIGGRIRLSYGVCDGVIKARARRTRSLRRWTYHPRKKQGSKCRKEKERGKEDQLGRVTNVISRETHEAVGVVPLRGKRMTGMK